MILVTGMHRSGTSLVCQLLAAMGVPFGAAEDRFPSDRWNAAGYFEQKAVMDTNSRLVTGWPRNRSRWSAWCSKLVYLCMPAAARIGLRAGHERAAITALGQQYHAHAVKDPRFCLTLRWWLQWAEVRHVVVCLRHPGAVVASLARRDRLPRVLAAKFCAYHLEALLAQLPDDRTLFVDVDRLVDGSADELERLRRGLGLATGTPASDLLGRVVRPDALGRVGAQPCPAAVHAAWQRLSSLAAAQRPAAVDAGPGER